MFAPAQEDEEGALTDAQINSIAEASDAFVLQPMARHARWLARQVRSLRSTIATLTEKVKELEWRVTIIPEYEEVISHWRTQEAEQRKRADAAESRVATLTERAEKAEKRADELLTEKAILLEADEINKQAYMSKVAALTEWAERAANDASFAWGILDKAQLSWSKKVATLEAELTAARSKLKAMEKSVLHVAEFATAHHSEQPAAAFLHSLTVDIPSMCLAAIDAARQPRGETES